jgi:hypothetical protein
MELASMLAGEPFSDDPRAVSRLLGAFLRTYNDAITDDRRQQLYPVASLVVGSAGGRHVERLRANLCRRWLVELGCTPPRRRRLSLDRLRYGPQLMQPGPWLARLLAGLGNSGHLLAMLFIDEVVALGATGVGPPELAPSARPHVRSSGDV